MFGGLSFMVNDRMVVAAGQHGNLLARVDPERSSALLARRGAKIAEMGAGRSMGPSWLEVDQEMLDDNSLVFWVDTALEYNAKAASR